MSRMIFALATVFLLSLPCAAIAQPYLTPAPVSPNGHPSPVQIFNWLDVNHDGYLTLEEYLAAPWIKNKAKATKFFHWMDTNNDGRVSLAEFLAAYKLYSGPSGYAVRVAYPGSWVWWRPWRYGWAWHGAGWRSGWNGGWYHVARTGHGRVVGVHRGHGHAHASGKHRGKHPKHPKAHKGKKHGHKKGHAHKKGHGHHAHKGHGHHGGHGHHHR